MYPEMKCGNPAVLPRAGFFPLVDRLLRLTLAKVLGIASIASCGIALGCSVAEVSAVLICFKDFIMMVCTFKFISICVGTHVVCLLLSVDSGVNA